MFESQRAEVTSRALRLVHAAGRALLLLLIGASPALAQVAATPADPDNYPNRTIRYIVPYPPGAFNDTLGRIFAQKLQEAWGVPMVVERPVQVSLRADSSSAIPKSISLTLPSAVMSTFSGLRSRWTTPWLCM